MTEPERATAPNPQAMEFLADAVSDVDGLAVHLADHGTDVELVTLLHDVRVLRQRLAGVEAYLESRVVRLFAYGDNEAGKLHFKIQGGDTKRRWTDHRTLAWRVVEPGTSDEQTGEELVAPDVMAGLLDRLFAALQVAYWRVKTLRAYDVDFGDLCETETSRRTVQFLGGEP